MDEFLKPGWYRVRFNEMLHTRFYWFHIRDDGHAFYRMCNTPVTEWQDLLGRWRIGSSWTHEPITPPRHVVIGYMKWLVKEATNG